MDRFLLEREGEAHADLSTMYLTISFLRQSLQVLKINKLKENKLKIHGKFLFFCVLMHK